MSALSPERTPKVLGMKPARNVVFRVYCPPIPMESELLVQTPHGVSTYRDFQIQKVDFQGDGSMVLHSLILVDSKPDLSPEAKFGDKIESWMELIAAVVDPKGYLRAESIVIGPEPSEAEEGGVN